MKTQLQKLANFKSILTLVVGLFSLSVSAQIKVLNNGYLRMGNGAENSINAYGNVQQPFYFDAVSSTWRKLTYSTYPLDIAVAVGGDKTNNWNTNGTVVVNPLLSGQVIDYSGYIATSGTTGWGVVKSTGTINVGGKLLLVEQTYTLPQSSGYIGIKVKVTNTDATLTENVRVWVGTRDDWVGTSDQPRKQRGNIVNGAFVQNTTTAQQALALKITSGAEAVLVYTNSNRGQTSVAYCCNFNNAMTTDPATSTFDITNDGSYAFYMRLNDLAPNASDEFTWYYAAGSLANIDNIINEVAQASGSVQNITCNTATYNATATANGTGYWITVPQGSAAPTAAQIKAGVNYGAVTVAASGNGAMTANTQRSFNISGLNQATNYTVYFVHEDAVPQFSAVISSNFSTLSISSSITASGNTTFCSGGSVILNANTATGLSYQWNNGGSPISGATSSSYTATTSGSYTVTTSRSGCPSATSNTIVVSVTPNPTSSITPPSSTTLCAGSAISLNANTGTGLTYQWKLNDNNISGANNANYIANAAGTYTVAVTASGCTTTSNQFVISPDQTNPVAACKNVNVVLDASGNGTIIVPATTNTLLFEDWTGDNSGYYSVSNPSYPNNTLNWNLLSGDIDRANFISGIAGSEIDLSGFGNGVIESKQTFNFTPGSYTFSFQQVANSLGGNGVQVEIGSLLNQTFISSLSVTNESATFTVTSNASAKIKLTQVGPSDAFGSFMGQIRLAKNVASTLAIENGSTDNCSIASITASKTNFTCSDVGPNTVTLTVRDGSGNVGTCQATVTVIDNISPVISSCPSNITVIASSGSGAVVNYTAPTASDVCLVSMDMVTGLASGSLFPVGTTTVTYRATDRGGNITNCSFIVDVQRDSDGDGIADVNDHDDDNDGILDVAECNKSNFFWSNPPSVSGSTATGTINGIAYTYTSSSPITTTSSMFAHNVFPASYAVPNSNPTIQNVNATNNTLTFASPIKNPVLVFASIGGGNSVPITFGAPIEVLWSSNVVVNSATQITGTEGYAIVRMNGTFSSISFNYQAYEFYCNFAFGADFTTCGDTDNDGLADYLDTDSDNDGCTDALEGSAHYVLSLQTNGRLNGPISASGVPTIAGAGQGTGNSQLATSNCGCSQGIAPSSITATANAPIYIGGNLNLSSTAGFNTYSWNGPAGFTASTQNAGITNAQTTNSGTYTVTGTNNATGCIATGSTNVSITCAPVAISNCPQTQYQQIYADSNNCSAVFTYLPTITGTNATASYTFSGATTGSGAGTGSGSNFNVGQTTVTINVTGTCGTASCSFVVTVVDNKAPKAISQNKTVYLNAAGTASVTPADINNGSYDNCGTVTLSMSQTGTICGFATEGQNVTLTAPAGAVITSIDFASYGTPNGSCGNYTQGWCHATNSKTVVEGYALNQNTVTIPATNGVFGDPCGGTVKRLYIQATWTGTGSSSTFNCAKVGNNSVNLIVTDANGNVATAPATVTVIDTIKPNAVAQNITVNLGASGTASITASQINNGSTDNCSISSIAIDKTNFSCADLTFNTINQVLPTNTSWTVSSIITPFTPACGMPFVGVSSLPASSTFTVTPSLNAYVTNIIPGTQALFSENNIRYFKKSFYLSSLHDINAEFLASVDNTVQIWINGVAVALEKDFDMANFSDNIYHRLVLGANGVNTNGGAGYQNFDVVNNVTASNLFVVGNNEIVLAIANCSGTDRGNISFKATITNKAPATLPVNLTVTDASNNVSTANALVTVVDNIAPSITCPANVSVFATSAAGAVVNYALPTATDNCTATVSLVSGLASGATFPLGTTTVTYKAQDQSGNSTTCSFNVTVTGVAPVIVSPGNITVNNQPNTCGANVNYTATETTGIPASTITYSIAPGSNFAVGTVQVTATATNPVGTSSTTFNVTVVDNQVPAAIAQNVTIQLDANGAASTTVAAVNNGSTDNCGIASVVLSKTSFDCSNVGTNNVTLTVTDVNGNVSTASAVVTVQDNIAPTAVAQNVTIQLDANGAASTTTAAVNNGSTDNCGIASVVLSKTSFDCSNVGTNNVTLTVTDVNGNVSTANAVVTVQDNIAPTAVAQNVTIQLDANGAASTTAAAVNNGSTDNCGIASVVLSKTSFDCSNVGTNNVTLTVTDVNGNVSTASAVVTVQDNIAPTVVAQNVTIQLDANGAASTTAAAVNNGSTDNCGIASVVLSKTSFDCSNVGNNNVTLTVTDVNGNVSTASAVVTVQDNIAPTAIAQNVTVTLVNGSASVTAAQVNNGSYDNCGIANLSVSPSTFNCGNIGNNTVTLTVTDVNGNISTTTSTVNVVGVVPSCSVTSAPRNNGTVIGSTNTLAAVNQMFLGYGAQSMNITCTATGAGPFTYSWSGSGLSNYNIANPVFTPTAGGNYTLTCTITNSYGCQSTCSITICVIDVRANGGSPSNPKVLLCHYPPGNSNNPQTLSISISAVQTHLGQHSGDRLGSCNAVCGFAKTSADGDMYTQETMDGEINLIVYPNPSNSAFNFKLETESTETVTITLFDMSGRMVLSLTNQNPAEVITIAQEMAAGVYMANVTQGEFVKTVKITKVN